jgi:ribosomal protein S18 acetylase RimI-like enzyme
MDLSELCPSDFESVFELWRRCLNERWPISEKDLKLYLFSELNGIDKINLGVMDGDDAVAMISSHRSGKSAGILLVLVAPEHQRKGVGRRLVSEVTRRHENAGVAQIKVGSVNCGYLWPGAPDDCLGAKPLFHSLGFETGSMYSLVLDTTDYAARESCPDGVSIRQLGANESEDLMAMQMRCGFGWESDFERPISQDRHEDIVVATIDGSIIGALKTKGPEQHHLWRKKLGDNMGEIDNVGVDSAHRRQGIGLAMMDVANQLMCERRVGPVLIGNTWLKDWYGRLGYRVWSEWTTCKATLPMAVDKGAA